jgi:hypothetical protein
MVIDAMRTRRVPGIHRDVIPHRRRSVCPSIHDRSRSCRCHCVDSLTRRQCQAGSGTNGRR